MRIKALLTEDDAVSPVIGVILMVAITVILAAVIATFVLGLGEQISDTAPQASFDYEYNASDNGNLTITHSGGSSLSNATLSFNVNGTDIVDAGGNYSIGNGWASDVSAGDSIRLEGIQQGDTVQVIWSSPDGDQTAILSDW